MGRTTNHEYDARNRLISTSYGDGTTSTKTYGTGRDANLVVEVKDRNDVRVKTVYDYAGRVMVVEKGVKLDSYGGPDLGLSRKSYEYREYPTPSKEPARITIDGKQRTYEYDYKDGRVISVRTKSSGSKVLEERTTYSSFEKVFCQTSSDGKRTFYAYREPDREMVRQVTELRPNACGESLKDNAAVLALSRDFSPNPGYAITDYEKDSTGRVIRLTDPLGIVTSSVYDSKGNEISRTEAVGLPEQRTVTMSYDSVGRLLAQTDALGRVTRREYTPAGRVKAVVYPDNSREEFTYFDDGKLATRKDADGFTSKQFWSSCCGRDAGSANGLGEGTLKFSDGEGRVTYTVQVKNVEAAKAALNFAGGITVPSDAVVGATTAKYDARGRLAATTKWLVAPSSVDPKNPPIATDAAQGLTTTYAYFDDLSDARFAPVLAELAKQSIILTGGSAAFANNSAATGSAVVVTNPAGESSFTVTDGAGRTVASGVFNK